MKPDWDQLGAEYASSSSVVIADVDCTVEQDLCSDYDVRGYPTIKYGDPNNMEDQSKTTRKLESLEVCQRVPDVKSTALSVKTYPRYQGLTWKWSFESR